MMDRPGDRMMESLEDARCLVVQKGVERWVEHPHMKNGVYFVPHFLWHFDFNHISDVKILRYIVCMLTS